MINREMRYYPYSTLGALDSYGQPRESKTKGFVKIAISLQSQSPQDNIKYKDTTYIGLTLDKKIDDKCFIHFGNEKLKVIYVNPVGRYRQVYMSEIL